MAAQILDGKSLAASIRAELRERVAALVQRGGRPGLAVVLAGDDAASRVYVRHKTLAAAEIGVRSELLEFPSGVTEKQLLERIVALNENPAVHSILVQLPLPKHIDSARVLEAVAPEKDVDGFHEVNLGALLAGRPGVVPCTPAGVMRLIEHAGVPLADAVVQSAAARAKPIALTALAAMLGAMFILDDPIFNGLAISLVFGIFVSTLLTLVVIPVLYFVTTGGASETSV